MNMSVRAIAPVDFGVNQETHRKDPLRDCVRDAVEGYFSTLNGHPGEALYDLVLAEVEAPLLETVLRHTAGNQTQAAQVLGMSRGTLRKKLARYDLI